MDGCMWRLHYRLYQCICLLYIQCGEQQPDKCPQRSIRNEIAFHPQNSLHTSKALTSIQSCPRLAGLLLGCTLVPLLPKRNHHYTVLLLRVNQIQVREPRLEVLERRRRVVVAVVRGDGWTL